MESSTGVRYERQEVSSTVSPWVEGSTPVRGKFFADFFSLIQVWHRCQNNLFTGKLEGLRSESNLCWIVLEVMSVMKTNSPTIPLLLSGI